MKKSTMIWFSLNLFWMGIIFAFSAQNAETSSELSGGITETITRLLFQDFDTYPQMKQEELLNQVSFVVRKLAHFTEYAILGFLLSGFFNSIANKKLYVRWGIGTLYAISDECHQFFSDGRAPRLFDVCVDSVGVFVGIIGFLVVCYAFVWYNEKVNKTF